MEFSEILAQLRRRWWLVLLGLLATGAMAYGTTLAVAVQYTAQSSLVLIPPQTTTDAPANPFLGIGGLNPAADVLVRALNSGTFHDQHAPAGGSSKYTVARDTDASGPLLVVDASAATPQATMDLLDAVVREAPVRLAQPSRTAPAPSPGHPAGTATGCTRPGPADPRDRPPRDRADRLA
jgi:hypothetical protein